MWQGESQNKKQSRVVEPSRCRSFWDGLRPQKIKIHKCSPNVHRPVMSNVSGAASMYCTHHRIIHTPFSSTKMLWNREGGDTEGRVERSGGVCGKQKDRDSLCVVAPLTRRTCQAQQGTCRSCSPWRLPSPWLQRCRPLGGGKGEAGREGRVSDHDVATPIKPIGGDSNTKPKKKKIRSAQNSTAKKTHTTHTHHTQPQEDLLVVVGCYGVEGRRKGVRG